VGAAVNFKSRIGTGVARRSEDKIREQRIFDEILVDAYGGEEQALGWYYYLRECCSFPFSAKCRRSTALSPLKVGEVVDVLGMAPEDQCRHEMFVAIRFGGRTLAVPLSHLVTVEADESTNVAVADWRYWTDRGYTL
jgi:hypothetical protein